jgi:DNA-binding MarR family transcriptional regulator
MKKSVVSAARPSADGGLTELEEELAMLVRALEAIARRRTYRLERAHYLLIRLIMREGPQSIGQAARRLFLDDSTATRQIAAMERLRLVRKVSNPADARSAVVHVTALGIRRAEAMRAERLRRLDHLFESWKIGERLKAAGVLRRLNASLASVLAEG